MNLLAKFNQTNKNELTGKELIVERLLRGGHINTQEAVILLKVIDIKIEAEHLEMSSGAKIVGGSDFEQIL